MVEWAGLESSLGSTGFDKRVDKDFETEKKGVWGDAADLNPSEVPLPAALPLFLIGLAGLRRFAKRRA